MTCFSWDSSALHRKCNAVSGELHKKFTTSRADPSYTQTTQTMQTMQTTQVAKDPRTTRGPSCSSLYKINMTVIYHNMNISLLHANICAKLAYLHAPVDCEIYMEQLEELLNLTTEVMSRSH